MTLLSRKSSRTADDESRARSASAERAQDQEKPSLFHRLSRRGSRSGDSTPQKPAVQDHPSSPPPSGQTQVHAEAHSQPRDSGNPVPEPAEQKNPKPKVAEISSGNGHGRGDVKKTHHQSYESKSHPDTTIRPKPTPAATEASETPDHHDSSEKADKPKKHPKGLTKDDVQHLFSGAPQYVLEKGRRGRYFPQAFFPWNNDLEISDLQDRRFLRHESFALSTLHAHLPIPDEVAWKPGMKPPVKKEGLDTGKRPMFELGIYERPNMLAVEGREPGTVGMRFFLEHPVADGVQDEKVREHGKDIEIDIAIANAPAMEAFKMLALSKENEEMNAKIGKHAPPQDRGRLIREGPHSWKAVGVRDISMTKLVERLEQICSWRDEVVNAGWRVTVLNKMNSLDLHAHLFGELLYPPRKVGTESRHDKAALKVQIEALVKVLTTPAAWLDLSIPESRLRFGKILHSRTTRHEHSTGAMLIDPERKWLLIQLLLSVELVVRLDAALRLGVALHTENFEISSEEIHHFNKLRNLKVDWDLVAARRFLFLSYVKKVEKRDSAPNPHAPPQRPGQLKQKPSAEHHSFIGSLRHTFGLDETKTTAIPDVCDIAILPRQPSVMVDGLFRFASFICWPRSAEIEARLKEKLCKATPEEREEFLMDAIICEDAPRTADATSEHASVVPSLESFCVDLHAATNKTIGGWLSHSWLSGLIMPGQSICDILMSTLLENDTDPHTLKDLGSMTLPLRSAGFVLNGSSWWSKSCIVARVMAPMRGSKECMGWVHTPNFVPLYEATLSPVSNRWVKVKAFALSTQRERPRIFDGDKLAMESTPLGVGKGGIMGSEFSMVTDHILDGDDKALDVQVQDIKIHLSNSNLTATASDHPLSAWAQIDLTLTNPSAPDSEAATAAIPITKQVRYGLDRSVYFVTGYPCRLPHGHATFKPGSSDADFEQQHPRHKEAEHIPAHPLHKTYRFVTKTLAEIVHDHPDLDPPTPTSESEVWVIDARSSGSSHHDHDHEHGGGGDGDGDCSTVASSTATTTTTTSTTATTTSSGHNNADPQLWEKDILVRAWCAEKGCHAIIARVGRTCLSCAIREAKALEISVVVRVGIKE